MSTPSWDHRKQIVPDGNQKSRSSTHVRCGLDVALALDATPHEPPLEEQEIVLLPAFVADLQIRRFHLFARLNRHLLPDINFEPVAPWRQALVHAIWVVDCGLLSLRAIDTVGGYAVPLGMV